jgi:cyanate permease
MADRNRTEDQPLNWTAIAALYAALLLGLVGLLYWGDYRNAAWLALIGTGGGLTAYGRVLEERGHQDHARRWKRAAGIVYAVFFVWAGIVLVNAW